MGTIEGGTALNVVPESRTLVAEVSALESERAEALVSEIVDRMHEAANLVDCDCDVEVSVERKLQRLSPAAPAAKPVRGRRGGAARCAHEPV